MYQLLSYPFRTLSFRNFLASYYRQLSADSMRIVWLRTGSNPADINRFKKKTNLSNVDPQGAAIPDADHIRAPVHEVTQDVLQLGPLLVVSLKQTFGAKISSRVEINKMALKFASRGKKWDQNLHAEIASKIDKRAPKIAREENKMVPKF